ncbi:hypothetical protein Tco_0301027 [Tanacetum coccineum]
MIYTALCYKFCLKHEKKQEEDKSVPVIMAGDQYAQFIAMPLCCVSETEEGLCKELQFSLVDNSKLNVVYLLNRSMKCFVLLLEGLQGGIKDCFMSKEIKKSPWKSWSKASVPLYESPFQPKPLCSSQHKPKLRPTKDFEAKYNKVKAKLALLSSSASSSKAAGVKNKGLIAKAYKWDKEEVSSDDNEMVEVKFDEKRGTIFDSNKEVVMISPRVRDVYVLDMTSST